LDALGGKNYPRRWFSSLDVIIDSLLFMENKLAIVIPAYKIDFFDSTLHSLATQTCLDFNVYVGDDCSPADFNSIIKEYQSRISIEYHRFDENLGGKDLVGHWKRCIELTHGEPWIWLFSDDDVIGNKCVELFYKTVSCKAQYDIYHFDVKIINSYGKIVYKPAAYPEVIDALTLYKDTSKDIIKSFVVENIFSRNIYDIVGGFESFPLAWGSDMATWLKMSKGKGLKTIIGDYIFWRSSDKNITPSKERMMVKRKFLIQADFYEWVNRFFNTESIRNFNKYVVFRYCVHYSNILSYEDMKDVLNYCISKKIVSLSQKFTTLSVFPLLRMGQSLRSLLINKV